MAKKNNTKSDLLRALSQAREIECLYHYQSEKKDKIRIIKKVSQNFIETSAGFMEMPQATLIDYEPLRGAFAIFEPTVRELNPEEKALLDEMSKLCTKEEWQRDIMTDGSICYFREKRFRETHKIGRMSMEEWYHKRHYRGQVQDHTTRGSKLYEFQIKN